ncbi:MAG: cysteine desulfurase family protein [Hyphomicrobiales bacterium]
MTAPAPIYCDYNATSPLRPSARAAMVEAMDKVGNPSSIHGFGRTVRHAVEQARASIVRDLGLEGYRPIFTSGATEALATALTPSTQGPKPGRTTTRLFVAATEHVAALQGHGFPAQAVTGLDVDEDGLLRLDALKAHLQSLPDNERALVCVHAANNETGVLQPIEAISVLCETYGAIFVCDMVQLAGRLPLGDAMPAIVILSGHKVGGPSGIGALIYDPQRAQIAAPLLRGGGQERGVRAGTENHIGIVGFAAALREATANRVDEQARVQRLRDDVEEGLRAQVPELEIFGQGAPRLANTSCFALPGYTASLALMQLDLAGIALSSGSACSSGKVKQSHVLAAMNIHPESAECALRLSFGFASTHNDVVRLLEALTKGWAAAQKQANPSHGKNSEKNATFAQSAIGNSA